MQVLPVPCPSCGAVMDVPVWTSANASRHPEIADAVLAGTFHVATCPSGHATVIEREVLYTDLDRGVFIGVFPRQDRGDVARCVRIVEDAFLGAVGENAPEPVLGWAGTIRRRVVFGYDELREKVLCFRHDLDDRLLESWKAAWTTLSGTRAELRLVDVQDGTLILASCAADDTVLEHLAVPRAHVDQLRGLTEAPRRLPQLFDSIHVHYQP